MVTSFKGQWNERSQIHDIDKETAAAEYRSALYRRGFLWRQL